MLGGLGYVAVAQFEGADETQDAGIVLDQLEPAARGRETDLIEVDLKGDESGLLGNLRVFRKQRGIRVVPCRVGVLLPFPCYLRQQQVVVQVRLGRFFTGLVASGHCGAASQEHQAGKSQTKLQWSHGAPGCLPELYLMARSDSQDGVRGCDQRMIA